MSLAAILARYPIDSSWVTIGSFDGVHVGHQLILRSVANLAEMDNSTAVALTFFPHPVVVIKNIDHPYYLTSPTLREDLIRTCGIDQVITLPFTLAMASLDAESFTGELVSKLGMKYLVAGPDFSLGRNRKGTIAVLKLIGKEQGFKIRVLPEVLTEGAKVSSSQIRGLLQAGNVCEATLLLGRYFSVSGEVIRGDGRGKLFGIPTANLQIWEEQLLPANGVYATQTWVDGKAYASVSNIGERPTFEKEHVSVRVETLILDFDLDLYGKTLKVEFVEFLRMEQRFETIGMLLDQIKIDTQKTREVFRNGIPKNLSA
jgi:riboflavin kinase/FMN adenylyltransferase